ncbi:hypothetical protein [Ligilactobacillus ruminis]|uniref:hypothetical protein n=1 Tax=Ligilactobacillus ruminis TaxID=1623 RepID=UPI001CDC1A64|nr:hypothetical protein [Ligilactobacillus ruminis]
MKEKFFYLEQKYGVKLLTNNQFGKKGNLYSLYVARKHLGNTYVCCADHLGISGNLINRKTELFAQRKAKELGIDNSLIKMDMSVWKISHYITDAKNCDLESSDEQLETIMGYLHRIHNIDVDVKDNVKIFDNVIEGNKLLEIASLTKENLKR